MTKVLLLSSERRSDSLYAEALQELRALGAEVRVVTMSRFTPSGVGLDGVLSLRSASEVLGPEFWRSTSFASPARRMWTHVAHNEWTLEQAREADVLVAVDPMAVYSVWQLAKRNPRALARSGVYAAVRAMREQGEPPAAAPAPATPTDPGTRATQAAARVIELMVDGVGEEALVLQDALALTFKKQRGRADFYGTVASFELASGRTPHRLVEAVRAELDYADTLLAAGKTKPAVASFLQALRLLFHRGVHFDSLSSPLSEDPQGYLAPLRDSELYSRLVVPRGRTHPAAPLPVDRSPRILVVANGNTTFVSEFTSRLGSDHDAEVRFLGPADLGSAAGYVRNGTARLLHSLLTDDLVREEADSVLRPHLDWADVVLVEWCTSMASFLSLVDPGDARVVVRLHSFEGWTEWPHLLDVSRVDEVVFVSDHLRELVESVDPRLGLAGAPSSAVAPNVMDLRRFLLPKHDDVRHTLAMIGYAGVAKDVRWTMELLRRLRVHDSRYRLLLFGEDMSDTGSAIYHEYERHYRSEVAELEALGAIERRGSTSDVPGALREVGVVVSSSVRESEHLAVKEGAASGAVPVVRDWPFFDGQQFGARTMYPASWVVATVEEAVQRILAVTADHAAWSQESAAASALALAEWDADLTAPRLARVLLG